MNNLSDCKWNKFRVFGENGFLLIKTTDSSIDSNKLLDGDNLIVPYITRSENDNGISKFVDISNYQKGYDQPNTISIGLDTQTAFYQSYKYVTGQNIQIVYSDYLDRSNALFLTELLKKQMKSKLNWGGNGATLGRLKRLDILVPIAKDNIPDFDFMSEYQINKQIELIKRYKSFAEKQIEQIEYKVITPLSDTNWASFLLTDIFKYQKGDQKNMNKLSSGDIPLVSAKKFNNGYKGFVKSTNILFNGNSITLNNDGDGGAGLAFYQPHDYYLDTHVTSLYSIKQLSKYALLFITKCISIQNAKFGNANPINSKRIKLFKIMLPINAKGEPDYEYMEQYMKNLMIRKYNQYFDYIKSLPYGDRI